MPRKLSQAERSAVNAVANTILPLAAWVSEDGKYDPRISRPQRLPWRDTDAAAPRLTVEALGFADTFERWLVSDPCFLDHFDPDAFIKAAAGLVVAPLKNCPIGDAAMKQWRVARGLKEPVFDGGIGSNVEFTGRTRTTTGSTITIPLTREAFYEICLEQLMKVVALRRPSSSVEWRHLVSDLASDNNVEKQVENSGSSTITGWDESKIKSSEFIIAITRDILRHCLSFATTGLTPDPVWAQALPLELSEQRRPANSFDGFRAETATERFVSKLETFPKK